MTSIESCELCREVPDRPAYAASESAVLVDDLDPVVPRHRPLVASDHVPSFAELSTTGWQWRHLAETVRRAEGGDVVMYEHGNATWNRSGRPSVDHAHIHIVPVAEATDLLVDQLLGLARWNELPDVSRAWATLRGSDYHLLVMTGGTSFVTTDSLPSQVFRRECAIAHGSPRWNWRARPCRA